MKRIVQSLSVALLCMVIVLSVPLNVYANPEKSGNNPSNWAKAGIEKAKGLDLVPEKLQREYGSSISREDFGELAVGLYEVLNGKETKSPKINPFSDTTNPKVLIGHELGILQGKGNGIFDPYDKVTREEISVMLYRTLQVAKPTYNYPSIDGYIFTDYNKISPWARESVGYLYGVGIINGVGEDRFNHKGEASREQAIVLVNQMYEKVIASEKDKRVNLVVSRSSVGRQESFLKFKLEKLIEKELGKPYQWGGTGPDGYDCSGLVYSLFNKLEISLPRTSKSQAKKGTYVSKAELKYGDLVFFARDGKNINHVGIYVGDGEFVHSPQSGEVVKTSPITTGYYARSYYTARRILP